MYIFAEEKDIEDKIQSDTTIAYNMSIEKMDSNIATAIKRSFIDNISSQTDPNKYSLASLKDTDLYYHTAILVTSNWNKNDDVFRPEIIWAAKNTPVDKPTNDGHDSMKIIGHMVDSWAIDQEGKILDVEDIKDLPNKFHILVGSVIYKIWPSAEEQEEYINELIEKIEAGEKFVSMECTFKNFDYALSSDEGIKIVERNKDTAFLSKYLRAYGGEGTYKGHKIGRAVSEISFCGKGYVDKPANPESVIFTKNDISDFAKAEVIKNFDENIFNLKKCGVLFSNNKFNISEKQMENDFYKTQADELKATNITLAKSLDELKEKLTASNVSKLEDEIKTLKAQINDMSEVLKKKSDDVTAKATEVADLTTKLADAAKASDELTKTNKELSDKIQAVEIEKKTVARVSTLVSGGFTKEEADEKVRVFASLDDIQFETVAKEIIEAKKFVKPAEKKDDKAKDKEEKENPGKADASDLEDVDAPKEEVASAGAHDGEFDITELSGKLSAALKTKDSK